MPSKSQEGLFAEGIEISTLVVHTALGKERRIKKQNIEQARPAAAEDKKERNISLMHFIQQLL